MTKNMIPIMVCPVCSHAKVFIRFQSAEVCGVTDTSNHSYFCENCCVQFETVAYDEKCKLVASVAVEEFIQAKVAVCTRIQRSRPLAEVRNFLCGLEEEYAEARVFIAGLLQGFYNQRFPVVRDALTRVSRSLQSCRDIVTANLSDRDRLTLIKDSEQK